jgi:tripartite-type tricarboxylate transporter receptor subunit TctC
MKKLAMVCTVVCICLMNGAPFVMGQEQGLPRNIEMIVPYQMGGLLDIASRIVVDQVAKELKVPVVVVNKAGASGSTGTAWVTKAKPDGSTLLAGNFSNLVAAYIFLSKLPYETKDFLPLAYVGESPSLLAVKPSSPWKTFEELIDDAKKNPGKLSYGTSGLSTTSSLNMELIKKQAGVDINRIIYQGGGESTIDVLGGHVDIGYAGYPVLQPHVKAGALRALATSKKIDEMPEVPTFAEKGVKDAVVNWSGFFAPAKIQKDLYTKLAQAFDRALANPETVSKLKRAGFVPERKTPSEISKLLKEQFDLTSDIAKSAKLIE